MKRHQSSQQENIDSCQSAGSYSAGLNRLGEIPKKGGIKLRGIFANPGISEKPVLTIQSAGGRDIFTVVKTNLT